MANRSANFSQKVSEEVGFEPTIRLSVYTLSKRAPSATRTLLQKTETPLSLPISRVITQERIASYYVIQIFFNSLFLIESSNCSFII